MHNEKGSMETPFYTKDFDYTLPEDRIARFPLEQRDQSKLLVFSQGIITDTLFAQLPEYLHSGSLLVINNSRVIHARLRFTKTTGSTIEIFLLTPHTPGDYHEALAKRGSCIWQCIIGHLKKWKNEKLTLTFNYNNNTEKLIAEKKSGNSNHLIQFTYSDNLTFEDVLQHSGAIPLPPYLNRKPVASDHDRYQTIYAAESGSVAAPTAGLHFTDNVLTRLAEKKINKTEITLHTGAGTFLPVKAKLITEHRMHTEYFIVNRKQIKQLQQFQNKITATGTTTLRCLESLYWIGVKLKTCYKDLPHHLQQWEYIDLHQNITVDESFSSIIAYMDNHGLNEFKSSTSLMIIPGYRFRIVNRLITNFHQPQSTLLMLVAAFTGNRWKDIYLHALQNGYRFLSYGDAMLLSS